jgi:hypothetical protein
MNNVVTIKISGNQHSELVIHPEKAFAINLGSWEFAYISFGTLKHHVKISMTNEVLPENILLSQNLVKVLHMPDYPNYEICVNGNEIIFGPYIGLLISQADNRLTSSRLNKMLIDLNEYSKLHGAVVVFALDKVDRISRHIEGYCYNPTKKCWQKGIFPYPSSIYRTIGLDPEWKNHFLSIIGDKMFNSRFFGKWEMYRWFSKDPDINQYIPYTKLYHSPGDIFEMLERFPKIYIKPVMGLQGRGIVRISMENKLLVFEYHEGRVNHIITFEDSNQANEYIEKYFHHGRYLIQQAIDLLEYKGRLIDFRCVVQKNQSNAWVCQAIIGRLGVKDSVVSNVSSGGTAFTIENILSKTFEASEENITELKQRIMAFAITVCNKLDEYGINCGTLGLDIGMDQQGRLWLIEINNRNPDPGIALDIPDTQLYYRLKAGPLFYAKFLAGFKEEL